MSESGHNHENKPSPASAETLEQRLRERADKLEQVLQDCLRDGGGPEAPEPEDDRHYYCASCATNAVSLLLMREAADALRRLQSTGQERIKEDHWFAEATKQAQRAEAAEQQIAACASWLKDGETPAERIQRERDDTLACMTLLEKALHRAEAAEQKVRDLEEEKGTR